MVVVAAAVIAAGGVVLVVVAVAVAAAVAVVAIAAAPATAVPEAAAVRAAIKANCTTPTITVSNVAYGPRSSPCHHPEVVKAWLQYVCLSVQTLGRGFDGTGFRVE